MTWIWDVVDSKVGFYLFSALNMLQTFIIIWCGQKQHRQMYVLMKQVKFGEIQ